VYKFPKINNKYPHKEKSKSFLQPNLCPSHGIKGADKNENAYPAARDVVPANSTLHSSVYSFAAITGNVDYLPL